jgi:minor extracellular serine protease Vpr
VTAAYSGQGPTADRRAKPELAASGAGGGGSVGTSYAAPRIAAIVACVLSRHPEWDPAQVKSALASYTRPLERRSVLGEAPRWIDTRAHEAP